MNKSIPILFILSLALAASAIAQDSVTYTNNALARVSWNEELRTNGTITDNARPARIEFRRELEHVDPIDGHAYFHNVAHTNAPAATEQINREIVVLHQQGVFTYNNVLQPFTNDIPIATNIEVAPLKWSKRPQ